MSYSERKGIKLALAESGENFKRFNERLDTIEKEVNRRLENLEKGKNQQTNPELTIQQKPGSLQEVKTAFLGCLSITTGHGLPQIVKPGNLFLNILWVIFYAVAVSGCGLLVYQAIDQYCQFDVITMTKIRRDVEITLPAVTICSQNDNTYDMIIESTLLKGKSKELDLYKMNNLTLYDKDDGQLYCVQLNYGTNVTELQKATGAGSRYGFSLIVYQPDYTNSELAITDNSARVVSKELKEYVYPGLVTNFVLSKTIQTALGPPHSNCNGSTDYRQVNSIEDCFKETMAECSPHWTEECVNNQSEIESKCNQKFPVECNQVSFQSYRVDYEWYIESFDLDKYKLKIEKKFDISKENDDEIRRKMTRVTIYFDKLETTVITQSPSMSLTSLIANVGGLLGLFLGFSLLSSIEALDLLIRIGIILSQTVKTRLRTRPT